ncbi:hypothetical protein [uncultured Arthrobacter sp.]|mgnify:CR=1 FL=1|uniref:hypothetical protein n=1 Tax=uncultured Arthrobacter sp. TaxID=114050 RepID=UPI0032167642
MTSQRAPFRLLRASAVAAAVQFLAVWAHVLAGGQLPAAPVMTALTVLVLLVVVLLTRWTMTAPILMGILASAQVLLHQAFSVLSVTALPAAAPSLHLHGTVAGGPGRSEDSGLSGHVPADLDPPMLGLHIGATLVTALMLARGEEALWALAAWLRPLTGVPAVPAPSPSAVAAPVPWRAMIRRWRVLRRPPLRGPPVSA